MNKKELRVEFENEFLKVGGVFFGKVSINDIFEWWIKKMEQAELDAQKRQTEHLMNYLYDLQKNDYYECSIEYFIKDQADMMKVKLPTQPQE